MPYTTRKWKELVEDYKRQFHITDWRIRVCRRKLGEDWCHTTVDYEQSEYKSAVMEFDKEAIPDHKLMIHEMLHLILSPISTYLVNNIIDAKRDGAYLFTKEERKLYKEQMRISEHEVIQKLVEAYVNGR